MVIDLHSRTTSFQQKVKEIAEQEWKFFDRGQKKECEDGYYQRVGDYWREGVVVCDRNGRSDRLWSAAFISWVMKQAGAGNKFKYSKWHSDYIRDAIKKRDAPNASFKGYRLTEIAPQVGDLVCFSSGEDTGQVDYDTTRRYRSHCDIVVATRPNQIDVIGGNVQNSVYKKTLKVDSQGHLIVNDDTESWFVVIQNLLQLDTSSETTNSYNARVKKSLRKQCTLKSDREHCSADPEKLATIDRALGHQIRVKRNEDEYALYTVSETWAEQPNNILHMTKKARSRLGTTDEFDATVEAQVPHPTYTDEQTEQNSEFVERLTDNGTHTKLIVIAPHGGAIEEYTDRQAEYFTAQLTAQGVSCWRCKGWWKKDEDEAFDRWHITSTDIHEASFPLLNTIIYRGFTYAVAFHGFSDNNILIGGRADRALKKEIQIAIQNAIAGSGIIVEIAPRSSDYSGDDRKNIVNRLANSNGIQIEQSKAAREQYWQEIAAAVASVYRDKI